MRYKTIKLGKTIWEWDGSNDYPIWYKSKSYGITQNTRIIEPTLLAMGAKPISESDDEIEELRKIQLGISNSSEMILVDENREKINEIIRYIKLNQLSKE